MHCRRHENFRKYAREAWAKSGGDNGNFMDNMLTPGSVAQSKHTSTSVYSHQTKRSAAEESAFNTRSKSTNAPLTTE